MELQDILDKLEDIRLSVKELADASFDIRCKTEDEHTKAVADFLLYELTGITCKIADLEETEIEPTESEITEEMLDTIKDWWYDLSLQDKCEIAGFPYPTCEYGRGEDYIEAEDRAERWWNTRTAGQKMDKYEEYHNVWWEED